MAQSYFFKSFIYPLLHDFIHVLFPPVCPACNGPKQTVNQAICISCQLQLPKTYFEKLHPSPIEKLFWGKVPTQHGYSAFFYSKKGRFHNLIYALKYFGNQQVALFLGRELGKQLIIAYPEKKFSHIIPIPLHPKKLKKRGYNQAELIAKGVSEVLQIPICSNLLYRNTFNPTQTKKSRFKRFQNVENIFALNTDYCTPNAHYLLIDDIITSGATLESAAKTLLLQKDCQISIATVAYSTN